MAEKKSLLKKVKDKFTGASSKTEEKKAKKGVKKEQDIRARLEGCLKNFFALMNREYLVRKFDTLDLTEKFDDIELFDFEIMVEDEFFDGVDTIPDGQLKTIPEFMEFLRENT